MASKEVDDVDLLVGLDSLPQILITWSIYVGAGTVILFSGLLRKKSEIGARTFLSECFPFNLRKSKSARLDIKVYLIGKLTDSIWGAPGLALSTILTVAVFHLFLISSPTNGSMSGGLAVVAWGLFLFLVVEFADFVMHFCEHKIPTLWELHKVHHSADSLNPLTAKRGHPVSLVLAGVVRAVFFCIPAGAAMYLTGLSLVEVIAIRALFVKACTLLTMDPLRHSPFRVGFGWLDHLFVSPHMHQVHHSSLEPHLDKNFGTNLSIFDWVFKTGYRPRRNENVELGLYGYSPIEMANWHSLRGTYIAPLLSASRRIKRQLAVVSSNSSRSLQNTNSS